MGFTIRSLRRFRWFMWGSMGLILGSWGIVFTCIIVGAVIGIAIYCSYVWWYLEPDIKKNGLRAQEHRLVPALFASMLLPVSFRLNQYDVAGANSGLGWDVLGFGWTAEKGTHWIVSVIGMFTCSRHEFAMRDVDVSAN